MSEQRPAGDVGLSRPSSKPAQKAPPRGDGRPTLHILLIDPDAASAERTANMLRQRYHVAVAATARAADALMASEPPDMIITEIDLPDADGVKLVERWRQAPATRHTLFIILTARRSVRDKVAAFQAGADNYVVKPVAHEQLLLQVQAVSRFRRLIHGPLTGEIK
jgi:two-component system, OmpR family, response regulator